MQSCVTVVACSVKLLPWSPAVYKECVINRCNNGRRGSLYGCHPITQSLKPLALIATLQTCRQAPVSNLLLHSSWIGSLYMIILCTYVRLERRTHLLSKAFNILVRQGQGQSMDGTKQNNNVLVKEGVIVYSGVEGTPPLSFVLWGI